MFRLEHEFTKDEILDLYLNRVWFGDGIHGVQSAAAYYFDKPPEALNAAETIYLIAGAKWGSCRTPRFAFDSNADRLVTAGLLDATQAKIEAEKAATLQTMRDRPACATHR